MKENLEGIVSGDTPFGLATNFPHYVGNSNDKDKIRLYANKGTKRIVAYIDRKILNKNLHMIDVWKIFLPVAGSGRERERNGTDLVD